MLGQTEKRIQNAFYKMQRWGQKTGAETGTETRAETLASTLKRITISA